MKSLTRQTIVCAFLISCSSFFTVKSQTIDKKVSTGSISGRVIMKGKGVAGVTVALGNPNGHFQAPFTHYAKTDQDGYYRIINVPPGTYLVTPQAPQFVVSSKSGTATLILGDGETIGDINFTLTKGGVITGRVTDSDGQPLIEQPVSIRMIYVTPNNSQEFNGSVYRQGQSQTDDRGVYRIFGLAPGKYKVSVGEGGGRTLSGGDRLHPIPITFYPDVNDISKATTVEVSEGGETTNIDIKVLDDTSPKFSVSGRVVDGSTGQPVSNLRVQVLRYSNESQDFKPGLVNAEGQFKVEGLPQGKYELYVHATGDVELRADSVQFEIINGNVNGLVVKTFKGASVSGQIILEGNDQALQAKLVNFSVMVSVQNSLGSSGRGASIGPDGSFHVSSLSEGTLSFDVSQGYPQKQLGISRIERDGVLQLRGIEVRDGDRITGVKVFVSSSNGTIRGVVKFENREAPPPGRISLELASSEPMRVQRLGVRPTEIDARGRFLIQGVPTGSYELKVFVYPVPGRLTPPTKQQVVVTDGAVSEVTIVVDLSPRP